MRFFDARSRSAGSTNEERYPWRASESKADGIQRCHNTTQSSPSGAIDRVEFSQPGGLGETLAASLRDFTPPPSQPGAFAASASSMAHAAALTNTPASTGPAYVNMPPVASAPPAGPGSYVVDGTPVVQATIVQAAPVVQSAPAVDPPPTYLPPQWEERCQSSSFHVCLEEAGAPEPVHLKHN